MNEKLLEQIEQFLEDGGWCAEINGDEVTFDIDVSIGYGTDATHTFSVKTGDSFDDFRSNIFSYVQGFDWGDFVNEQMDFGVPADRETLEEAEEELFNTLQTLRDDVRDRCNEIEESKTIDVSCDDNKSCFFLTEDNEILGVCADDWLSFDDIRNYDCASGAACNYEDLERQLIRFDMGAYCDIFNRTEKHFAENGIDKYTVKKVEYPFISKVEDFISKVEDPFIRSLIAERFTNDCLYDLLDKTTGACVYKIRTDKEDLNLEEAFDIYKAATLNKLHLTLDYCEYNGINISDLLEYRELKGNYGNVIAFVSREQGELAGNTPKNMIEGTANWLQSCVDGEVFRVKMYDIYGEQIDDCRTFFGTNIAENGIEDMFGRVVDKLGSYNNIEECLEENKEKLGIEIELIKSFKDRIKTKNKGFGLDD